MTRLTVIYGGEQLTMAGDLVTDLLIVHCSTPASSIDTQGHRLEYKAIEVHGSGSFEVRHGQKILHRIYS